MKYDQSKLFNKPGYFSVKEYIEDINSMIKNGPWKLPFRIVDKVQFLFLQILIKFSWFSDMLYIQYPYKISPAYSIILLYLKKKNIFDNFEEVDVIFGDRSSYLLKKDLLLGKRTWTISGQGIAKDRFTAISKAIGEMTERMISGMGDANKIVVIDSPNNLVKKNKIFLSTEIP